MFGITEGRLHLPIVWPTESKLHINSAIENTHKLVKFQGAGFSPPFVCFSARHLKN